MTTQQERRDYWATVETIAKEALELPEDEQHDYVWESVDGCQWIIYYANNKVVLDCSDNDEAFEDQGMELDTSKGWRHILVQVAFCAMEQDVQDKLCELADEKELEEDRIEVGEED